MTTTIKALAIPLLLIFQTMAISADYKNAGECLVDAYQKYKPARVVYWTQFQIQRVPNLPEHREARDGMIELVKVQEDLLEIELNRYLTANGTNVHMMALAPFTVPYVSRDFFRDEQEMLLKHDSRYAELSTKERALWDSLSKYQGKKILSEEAVKFFMNNVMPKLKADLDAAREEIKDLCNSYYRE